MDKAKNSLKDEMKSVALQRIRKLFELAEANFDERPELSKRYVWIARKIAMRHNVRFDFEIRKKFCKKCGAFLSVGKNAKVRVGGGIAKLSCIECGFVRKICLKRKQKVKEARKNPRDQDSKKKKWCKRR
ncbi:MAG: ribonuclease P [Candidatus Diapherotrites archaeon]|nr:ribonuclease P [Candidatus Diapherotrites archaeon]